MQTQTPTKIDVYQIVTDHIIEPLEDGTVPWKKPWAEAGLFVNRITCKPQEI